MRKRVWTLIVVAVVVLACLLFILMQEERPVEVIIPPEHVKAFPGAIGYGSDTPGGRGGRTIYVTSTEDSGPGSLREALKAEGKRIVVFAVAGTIHLKEPLDISRPYVTIAGQTAPAPGITLVGAPMTIRTHDVIVRHIRSRPGDGPGFDPEDRDGFQILDAKDVILDHVSATWAIDENIGLWYSPSDITIQDSIIAEALYESRHPEGIHSMGLLVGDGSQRVTVARNLFAHNNERNPLMKGGTRTDIVNNVVYGWCPGGWGTHFADPEDSGPLQARVVANYYIGARRCTAPIKLSEIDKKSRISVTGNILEARGYKSSADMDLLRIASHILDGEPGIFDFDILSAEASYDRVISSAGAFPRDGIDSRIVEETQERRGSKIDSPPEGYPAPAGIIPLLDSDLDGMPDSWEETHGLDPADASDSVADRDGDGYTNIEEYINSI